MRKDKKNFRFFWEDAFDEFDRIRKRTQWPNLPVLLGTSFPVNISDAGNKIILRAELPGFKKDEINVNVTENAVHISAEKKKYILEKSEKFYRKESSRKSINRSFSLPEDVDTEHVEAKLEDGILMLVMPKAGKKKKKRNVKIN